MTEYTAEDFARARVAIQGERESARRTYPGDDLPWLSRNGGRWSDHALAELGWTPVQENVLTDDAIKTLVAKRERVLASKIREEYSRNPFPSPLRLAAAVYQGLTEKPRPEGAYELETVIGLNAGKWTNGADVARAVADLLAENGFRVVGEQL